MILGSGLDLYTNQIFPPNLKKPSYLCDHNIHLIFSLEPSVKQPIYSRSRTTIYVLFNLTHHLLATFERAISYKEPPLNGAKSGNSIRLDL